MRFTDIFIRRPVLAVVLNLIILVGGLQAIRSLNVRQYPRLQSATITVSTIYIGASATLVRGFITTPIERAIAAAEGIDYIESQSSQGISTVNVRLKLNVDAGNALADISARVNQIRGDLPPEAELPSISIEPSDSQFAQMYLSFDSAILAPNQVTDYLIRVVQPRLSAVPGVQRAEILGGRAFALRAWLKPDRMAALGVSPSEIWKALSANNSLSAVGQTRGQMVEINLTASTGLKSVEEFQKLVVKRDGDNLVRLSEVAEVVLGADSYDTDVRMSGKQAVFMGVFVLPSANSLEVISDVRREFAALERDLPTGLSAAIGFDATRYIENAIDEVIKTLLETIAIVMLVIYLFLGSFRTVLVPIVSIPLSLIGGIFLMQVFGFSLNLLTLLAIVLSVGLVVDDAIVVVENVERRIREGQTPFEAALAGARELVAPIVAMTITLAAVYVPIGFQGGITGALFREFAFTLAGAVAISGVVALTLSPMLSSRMLSASHRRGWLVQKVERAFEAIRRRYERLLSRTLQARPAVYLVWAFLSVLIVPLYLFSAGELAPTEDQGIVFTALELPPNTSLEQSQAVAAQVQERFASTPEYTHTFQITSTAFAFGGMIVKPWHERTRDIFAIQGEMTGKTMDIATARVPIFLPPPLPSAGMLPVEVVIASTADHEEIVGFAQEIAMAAAQSGKFAFPPMIDVKIDQANTEVVLDRDKIAAMGLTLAGVGADLSAMLSGAFVNRFDMDGRSYKVIPQVERKARLAIDQLSDIYIGGPSGQLIPLGSVATLKTGVEPRSLNRMQQLNAVKLSGVPTQGLSAALAVIEDLAAKKLPAGYRLDYTGESRQLRQEGGKFLPAMLLALLLIFLVLAAQFNSFRDPLVILAGSVPLAMFGALLFTFLKFTGPPGMSFGLTEGWTTTLNIYSQVGLVTLVGLISKNAILIVEFANVQQRNGLAKIDAVHAAAVTRLRPILMTTAATVAGHFPLTLVSGPGAIARNSIGLVLVGGMAVGTLFTLLVVPSLYILLARDHRAEGVTATVA
jgi:multidrug efflux pump